MTDKTVIGENATQIRVPAKQDSEQIKCLAFIPVGRCPDRGNGWHHRKIIIGGKYAQTHTQVVRIRNQVVYRGVSSAARGQRFQLIAKLQTTHRRYFVDATTEPGATGVLGLPFDPTILRVIDTAEIEQLLELKSGVIAQCSCHFQQVFAGDFCGHLVISHDQSFQLVAKFGAQGISQLLSAIRHISARWYWCV